MVKTIEQRQENQLECYSNTLICFNVFAFILSAAVFSLTIWVRLDSNFQGWIAELEMEHYWIGIYFLMFSTLITCAITFLGCFATFTENTKLLMVYAGVCVLAFIGNLGGSALVLNNGLSSSQLTPWLTDKIMNLIIHSQDQDAAQALRVVQESVGCCGAQGPNDYININMPVPLECRNTVTGNVFPNGCVEHFGKLVETRSAWISSIALTISVILIVMGIMAFAVRSKVNAINRREDNIYNRVQTNN